jgi:hypothetical protein
VREEAAGTAKWGFEREQGRTLFRRRKRGSEARPEGGATIFSELLHSQILADVPHAQWVFSIPKMLRPYFLYHRELLGDWARLAYDTVREMMAAAVDEPAARPGMVAVIQTFGSSLKWNPHIHAIVTRGVFLDDGSWHPVPYVDEYRAELLFRHKILRLLRDQGLISQERIDLLLSWRHSLSVPWVPP